MHLGREFAKWVLLANLIAWPVAYIAMHRWLQNFAYRTHIGVEIFIYSAIIVFIFAIFNISYQVVKAAKTNPVDCLRYE